MITLQAVDGKAMSINAQLSHANAMLFRNRAKMMDQSNHIITRRMAEANVEAAKRRIKKLTAELAQ